jgi:membrane protein insertase Oxa1/YidC/SpoIIIJ
LGNFFSVLLTPITIPMNFLLGLYSNLLDSPGLGIIALSLTFSLVMLPVSRWAQGVERSVSEKIVRISKIVESRRGLLRGEALFNLKEKIYEEEGFHPIQGILTGLPLLIMLPVLISSILVITASPNVSGSSFAFVKDLGLPDALVAGFNILPFVMFAITLVDAFLRFRGSPAEMVKFSVISLLLLILVYNLASGLVVFWIANNLFSFIVARTRQRYTERKPERLV